MARLIIEVNGTEQDTFELGPERVTCGRSKGNAIVIKERESSRQHFAVEPTDRGWKVVDLESSNGTQVNDKTVNAHELQDGDIIGVGETMLRFVLDEDEKTGPRTRPGRRGRLRTERSRTAGSTDGASRRSTLARTSPEDKDDQIVKNVAIGAVVIVALFVGFGFLSSLTGTDPAMDSGANYYSQGERLYEEGNYPGAIAAYKKVPRDAGDFYTQAQERIDELKDRLREQHASAKISEARTALGELRAYAQRNADNLEGILKEARAFKELYPGTMLDKDVDVIVQVAREAQKKQAEADFEPIQKEVDAALKNGQYGDAAGKIEAYLRANKLLYDAAGAEDKLESIRKTGEDFFYERRNKAEDLFKQEAYEEAYNIYRDIAFRLRGGEIFGTYLELSELRAKDLDILRRK
jgi:pSer/pThr/pTyr-binding forkhead associated (FHA) protein